MNRTRREFTKRVVALSGMMMIDESWLSGRQSTSDSGDTLLKNMLWFNLPASSSLRNGRLTVKAKPKTDFWRKTFYGYITDSGHFLHRTAKGDFTFEVRVDGAYRDLYDQAGLMVRADAENWMKCGTEMVDGKRHASVVFTRDFSDWSTMNDLSQDKPVWWRAVRKKDSIETLCSLDGKTFLSVRQGYMDPSRPVEVGIMCAAPEGQGFEAVFENLKLVVG